MINLPPRHTKSELATIHFPAWILEQEPTWRIIVGSHSASLAKTFSGKTRAIIRRNGRVTLDPAHRAVADWATTQGGGLKAVGRGGGITGHGAELVIIDDPVKGDKEADSDACNDEAWGWYGDIYTRLEPGGCIIYMGTRWRENDLAGRILASGDGPNWTVVVLPGIAEEDDPLGRAPGEALCPERYTSEMLLAMLPILGELEWSAEIQQRIVSASGAAFKIDKIKYLDETPELVRVVCAWDTAGTPGGGDWSVGVVAGFDKLNRFIVADLSRFQRDAAGVDAGVTAMAELHGQRVHYLFQQAPGDAGKEQAERKVALLSSMGYIASSERVTGAKIVRADGLAALVNSGNFYLVRAPWNAALVAEMRMAPKGKHDDQWDALASAYNKLTGGKKAQRERILNFYGDQNKLRQAIEMVKAGKTPEEVAASINLPVETVLKTRDEKKKAIDGKPRQLTDPSFYRPR